MHKNTQQWYKSNSDQRSPPFLGFDSLMGTCTNTHIFSRMHLLKLYNAKSLLFCGTILTESFPELLWVFMCYQVSFAGSSLIVFKVVSHMSSYQVVRVHKFSGFIQDQPEENVEWGGVIYIFYIYLLFHILKQARRETSGIWRGTFTFLTMN